MEFSILGQKEETQYHWLQGFRIDRNISSVMNYYCKVVTSIGMMSFHLIINSENCCVARPFVFCSIYSEVCCCFFFVKS